MDFRSTFIVILIFFVFGSVLVWMLISWGRKFKKKINAEKLEYDVFYLWLSGCIEKYELHKDNYSYLKTKLLELRQMKYKDHERTSVLTVRFFRRFERFALDDVEPDEHSIEACFGENDWN